MDHIVASHNQLTPWATHWQNLGSNGISSLPQELLVAILQNVARVPYEIEPTDFTSHDWQSTAVQEIDHRHRYCVLGYTQGWGLVCKTWRRLSVPLVVEWITISRVDNIPNLLELLRSHVHGSDFNRLGSYTKRLDLSFKDSILDGDVLPNSLIQNLAAVIYELSNLEIVTIKSDVLVGYRPFGRRILKAFTVNLKVILWLDRIGQAQRR